eukprot:gene3837-4094_t
MGTDWIAALKVVELKEELKKRGLPQSGNKAVLAQRLVEYVEANEGPESGPSKEPTPVPVHEEDHAEHKVDDDQEDDQEGVPGEEQAAAATIQAADRAEAADAGAPSTGVPEQLAVEAATAGVEPDADITHAAAPTEEVLDFEEDADHQEQLQVEEEPAVEEADAAGMPSAAAQQDQAMADAAETPADSQLGKRPADGQQAAGTIPSGRNAAMAEAADQQQPAKRSKRTPIPPPSLRKPADAAATPTSAQTGKPSTATPAADGAASAATDSERKHNATAALLITGLKRPFTAAALDEKLAQTGVVIGRWLPQVKDKAYVIMKEDAHAHATRSSLNGCEWPTKTKPFLYWLPLTDEQVAEKRKRATGSGNGDGTGRRDAAAGGLAPEPVGPAVQEGLVGTHNNRH